MPGYPDQARRRCQEALSLAQTLSHPFSEAFILGHLAVLSQFGRDGHAVCGRSPMMTQLAEAYGIAGQTAAGLRALKQAQIDMETSGEL